MYRVRTEKGKKKNRPLSDRMKTVASSHFTTSLGYRRSGTDSGIRTFTNITSSTTARSFGIRCTQSLHHYEGVVWMSFFASRLVQDVKQQSGGNHRRRCTP